MKHKPPKRKKSPRGSAWRPIDEYGRVEAMASRGCTEEICGRVLFGVGDTKFKEMLREDPKLSAAYKRGAANVMRSLQETAYNLAPRLAKKGNVALLIFLLKTKGGFREVARVEGEVIVKPHEAFAQAVTRAPVEVQRLVSNLTTQEKARLVKSFSAEGLPDGAKH